MSVDAPVTFQLPAKEQNGIKEDGERVPSSFNMWGGWLIIFLTWGVSGKGSFDISYRASQKMLRKYIKIQKVDLYTVFLRI